jgi:RimJ/RimL family protein N-acetyltransferase
MRRQPLVQWRRWQPEVLSPLKKEIPTMSTATATEDKKQEPVPGTGHIGQTFLVGEHVYIRALEADDAKYASWWRDSPFPLSPGRVETLIKEELHKEERRALIVMRKSDDLPVGAIWVHYHPVGVSLKPHLGSAFGEYAKPWLREALTMIVPWIIEEQHRPVAHIELPGNETEAITALEEIGGRITARFREMLYVNRERQDQVVIEYLNRQWVDRIGDPNNRELERTGTGQPRPVPAKVTLDGDPPLNAIMVGPRVYLRPIEEKDGEVLARLTRQETETFHETGRRMYSALNVVHWHEEHQKKMPPTWIRFGVCLRENDEIIGGVGIDGIDRIHRFAESESELLNVAYRGAGYGTEAKHLLLEYAFNTLGLHSLQSYVLWENTRSAAALRKQGYREAGRVNWTHARHGRYNDEVVFDLLADDWRKLPRE